MDELDPVRVEALRQAVKHFSGQTYKNVYDIILYAQKFEAYLREGTNNAV